MGFAVDTITQFEEALRIDSELDAAKENLRRVRTAKDKIK